MKTNLKSQYYTIKKRKRLSQKLNLSREDKNHIKHEFSMWLLGIEEDDPLPKEISCLIFCFEFDNKAVNLSVSGSESTPNVIIKAPYSPLEAQYFFCELLNAYFNNKSNLNSNGKLLEKVKKELFDFFEDTIKSFFNLKAFEYLNNKKIVIGEYLHEKSKSFRFITNI